MPRSAFDTGHCTVVCTVWLVLLTPFGSLLVDTVAVFWMVDPQLTLVGILKVMVKVFVWPGARLKLLHSTLVPAPLSRQSVDESPPWKATSVGKSTVPSWSLSMPSWHWAFGFVSSLSLGSVQLKSAG